ncbi:N-formylglutamate amidohydrolase [Acidisphaera rubrifaciens HS-AP3]|uniref:N-formylglutamate amidohydrolase n=2 Tax=Acidisphaera TaxID=50714 RepID=A0A0D6P4C0_9PROT|nr:N-formylglutamate amidohydrolase [Acidisphaera rubrifaciens HS-AP3]
MTGGAPFMVLRPERQTVPLVVASAHSGRAYDHAFLAESRLDPVTLRRSEDSFVDELFAAAPSVGAPLIAAEFPRAYCDPNREAWELDPTMFEDALPPWVNIHSPRVAAGLGTIARVVSSGDQIYRKKLRFADAERRVRECWQPFHQGLLGLLDETTCRFGAVLLVDCHSMPTGALSGRGPVDFVIGDVHGTSCSEEITRLIETELMRLGYRVRRNDPYAGGYITRTYGRPKTGRHAVQIEVARRLYMDEVRFERRAEFRRVARQMEAVLVALAVQVPAILGL